MADADPSLRPRLPRATSHAAERHANAKSSLSLKWEDFFGTSVDLTSGVLNAFDSIATEINIDEEAFVEEEQSLDVCDHLGSSPTDIVLLNALPASTPCRYRGMATKLVAARGEEVPTPAPRACTAPKSNLIPTTATCMDSGYASEEAVFSGAGAATSSSGGGVFRSATLPCRGRAGAGSRSALKDLTTSSSGDRIALRSSSPDAEISASVEKALRVVQELVETERSYVNDLSLIVQGYMEPMREDKRFAEESVSTVFGVLPKLCSFHETLLTQLSSAQVGIAQDGYSAMANCFLSNREHFQYYSHYCTNFPRSLSHLQELFSDRQGAEFFASRQKALQQMLPLQTFLLKPVQRILKYHLLLQTLVKTLSPPEPRIEQAAHCMTDVATHINDLQRRHEHALRVRQLQSLLKSAHLDLGSLGELVLEDSFRLYGKKGTRQVFLFHKAILLGKRLESGMLAIKEVIRCANLMLIESIPKDHLSFHVLPFDNPKAQQTLQARTLEQKRRWCQEIKRLILENYNMAIPEKAKQLVLNLNLNLTESGGSGGVMKRQARYEQHCFEVSEPELQSHSPTDTCFDEFTPLPMSRCFSSSEDLVTIHEEAWQELLRRTVHNRDEDSLSCSSSSDDAPFDDLRCIAVEINEERLDNNNRHHRRQQSAGKASYILRATIDSSLSSTGCEGKDADCVGKMVVEGVIASVAHSSTPRAPVSVEHAEVTQVNSHNPVYIHCPKKYDHLVFGKAYQEYIEKTKTMSALSPADIDEIFKPLKELHVQVDARSDEAAGATTSLQATSSADSSPRHVVSRIATSNSTAGGAAAENCRRSEEELCTFSPQKNSNNNNNNNTCTPPLKTTRSNSVMGTIFGGIKSALQKTNSSHASLKQLHGSNTSIKDADETLRHEESVPVVRSQSSSHSLRNRPEKPLRNTSSSVVQSSDVTLANSEATAARPLPRLRRCKNNSQTQSQDEMTTQLAPAARTQSHSPKPLHYKSLSTTTLPSAACNPVQKPSKLASQKPPVKPPSLGTSTFMKPPSLPSSVPDESSAVQSNSATLRRKKKQAPEPPQNGCSAPQTLLQDERSTCRGKIRAAMTDLMDSLPFADDEQHQHGCSSTLTAETAEHESRRATGEWAADNVYWKRALLDTRSPAAIKAASLRPATRQHGNHGPSKSEPAEEVVEETPRRGTVANMISRFQHAT